MKRTILWVVIAVALIGGLWALKLRSDKSGGATGASVSATQAVATATSADDKAIITVNGDKIFMSDYQAALDTIPAETREKADPEVLKKRIVEELVRVKILDQEAKKIGVDKDPKVVKQIQMLNENLLASATLEKLIKDAGNPDLQKVYEENKDQFQKIKVRQILIGYEGSLARPRSGKALSDAQARAKAQSILDRIRKGESFAALAKSESDDVTTGAKGGDLGVIGRGEAPPELDRALFALPVDVPSGPVKSRAGYHIFEVTEKQTRPFEEVKQSLEQRGPAIQARKIIADLKTKSKIDYDPTFMPVPPTSDAPVTATAQQ